MSAPRLDNEADVAARQIDVSAWIERALWIGFLAPGIAYWLWRVV